MTSKGVIPFFIITCTKNVEKMLPRCATKSSLTSKYSSCIIMLTDCLYSNNGLPNLMRWPGTRRGMARRSKGCWRGISSNRNDEFCHNVPRFSGETSRLPAAHCRLIAGLGLGVWSMISSPLSLVVYPVFLRTAHKRAQIQHLQKGLSRNEAICSNDALSLPLSPDPARCFSGRGG